MEFVFEMEDVLNKWNVNIDRCKQLIRSQLINTNEKEVMRRLVR